MMRPHFLRAPAALPRREHRRRLTLGRIFDTLALIAVVAAALAIGKAYIEWAADDIARERDHAATTTAERCPIPAEHEQVHVIVTQRDGRLEARCLMVGARGAYHRTPDGMPGARP